MGKSILSSINGIPYSSKAAVIGRFMQRRNEDGTDSIESGLFTHDLKSLFVLYCKSYPDWELNGRLVNHFEVKAKKNLTFNGWVATYCYEVHLSNGEHDLFCRKSCQCDCQRCSLYVDPAETSQTSVSTL